MSSSGAHSGPSLVVSHSAFSSPPSWERRAAESARGSLRVAASASGCFQLACLFLNAWFPTLATFNSRLGESSSHGIPLSSIDRPFSLHLSCASLAASTSPSVSIARTPEAFATLGAIARYCDRKAIVSTLVTPPCTQGSKALFSPSQCFRFSAMHTTPSSQMDLAAPGTPTRTQQRWPPSLEMRPFQNLHNAGATTHHVWEVQAWLRGSGTLAPSSVDPNS